MAAQPGIHILFPVYQQAGVTKKGCNIGRIGINDGGLLGNLDILHDAIFQTTRDARKCEDNTLLAELPKQVFGTVCMVYEENEAPDTCGLREDRKHALQLLAADGYKAKIGGTFRRKAFDNWQRSSNGLGGEHILNRRAIAAKLISPARPRNEGHLVTDLRKPHGEDRTLNTSAEDEDFHWGGPP